MKAKRRYFVVATFSAMLTATPARAQDPHVVEPAAIQVARPLLPPPQDFGTGLSLFTVAAVGMTPTNSATTYIDLGPNGSFGRVRTGGGNDFASGLAFPTGTEIEFIQLHACDTSPTAAISAAVWRCPVSGAACEMLTAAGTGGPQTAGCGVFFGGSVITPRVTDLFNYVLQVTVSGNDSATSFSAVRIGSRRIVSPAPGTASFADVPVGHPYHRFVEALVASGVTGGCGSGNYCPDLPLTRGQMATFLAVALGLQFP